MTKQRGLRRCNRTWRLRCGGAGVRNDSQTPSLRTWVENFPLCFLRELDISQELLVGVMPSFRKKLPENGANTEENETGRDGEAVVMSLFYASGPTIPDLLVVHSVVSDSATP